MSSDEKQDVCCPICAKNYSSTDIEDHVNKCIFLNSEHETSLSVKRVTDEQFSTQKKRVKHNVHTSPSTSVQLQNKNFHEDIQPVKANVKESMPIRNSAVPLAEQMRPSDLSNFVGQDHVLGQNKVLRTLLEKRDIPSMILWGPPGCGKTTLAHIIAQQCKSYSQSARFVKLSATMSGVNDVKEVIKVAKNELAAFKRHTILFMDEIHRFNKLQQDIFLPHVESGAITLIGATTENPSFSLNNALLSRCRVIVLEKLSTDHLVAILERALHSINAQIVRKVLGGIDQSNGAQVARQVSDSIDQSNGKCVPRILIDSATVLWLAEMCDGDARIALNSLQLALQSRDSGPETVTLISLEDIKDGVKRSHLLYDKKGEEHYNIISAMHKSIRASDDNAALYWMTRMLQGGEDPIFVARRLVRAASEDIGMSDPMALTLAVSTMHGCQLLGMPECDVLLAQCAVYLARAPKSTEVYGALCRAKESITEHRGPQPSVPLHLRNAPTRLMKDLGYGKGYNMRHKDESNLEYMPEGLENVTFF